jgi:PKD repeat protein
MSMFKCKPGRGLSVILTVLGLLLGMVAIVAPSASADSGPVIGSWDTGDLTVNCSSLIAGSRPVAYTSANQAVSGDHWTPGDQFVYYILNDDGSVLLDYPFTIGSDGTFSVDLDATAQNGGVLTPGNDYESGLAAGSPTTNPTLLEDGQATLMTPCAPASPQISVTVRPVCSTAVVQDGKVVAYSQVTVTTTASGLVPNAPERTIIEDPANPILGYYGSYFDYSAPGDGLSSPSGTLDGVQWTSDDRWDWPVDSDLVWIQEEAGSLASTNSAAQGSFRLSADQCASPANPVTYTVVSGTNEVDFSLSAAYQGQQVLVDYGEDEGDGTFITWGSVQLQPGQAKPTFQDYCHVAFEVDDSTVSIQTGTFTVPANCVAPPQKPTASFTDTVSGLKASFHASGTGTAPLSYSWNFGDSKTGSGATTSHTYAKSGSYSVKLTVSNAAGSATATKTVKVTAPPPPLKVVRPVAPASSHVSVTTPNLIIQARKTSCVRYMSGGRDVSNKTFVLGPRQSLTITPVPASGCKFAHSYPAWKYVNRMHLPKLPRHKRVVQVHISITEASSTDYVRVSGQLSMVRLTAYLNGHRVSLGSSHRLRVPAHASVKIVAVVRNSAACRLPNRRTRENLVWFKNVR